MKRAVLALILALGLAAPAVADVTIKSTMTGKGMGMSGKTTATTYIKGNKMRTDSVIGGKTQTVIFDVDAQKMYSFESGKKEADVYDMQAFGAEMSKTVDVQNIKGSIKPNGQTKQISGQTASGYDMEISVPAGAGGAKDGPQMTITLQGPVWIVKNAPGAADYSNFYKNAVEKGWIFSDPRAAKGQPGQAKAMAEMYKQFADIGGIAYETDMNIKMGMGGAGGGGGALGGFLAKLGNISMNSVVDSVDTGAVADSLFAPPADYKLKPQK